MDIDTTIDNIVLGPSLVKLYTEHREAFTPDSAASIEAALAAASTKFAGPAMSLMMDSLVDDSSETQDFFVALESSDSLTSSVSVKVKNVTVFSSGSMFPQTYYPCMKVVQIDFMSGDTLTGLTTGDIFICSGFGNLQDVERMSTIKIASITTSSASVQV